MWILDLLETSCWLAALRSVGRPACVEFAAELVWRDHHRARALA